MRFGELVAIRKMPERYVKGGPLYYFCRCDCGVEKAICAGSLKSGASATCGHRRAAYFRTHGLHALHRAEFAVWQSMIQRCTNPKSQVWAKYGGRGITVCDRWRDSFPAFIEDMGPRPSDGHSIDRKDNDGPYDPGNCRWATPVEQGRNTRQNHVIEHEGRHRTIAEWSEITDIQPDVIGSRLKRGWTESEALSVAPGSVVRDRDSEGKFLPRVSKPTPETEQGAKS